MTEPDATDPAALDRSEVTDEDHVVPSSAPQAEGSTPELDTEGDEPAPTRGYEEELGISADVAGGSVPAEIRHPEAPQ